MVASTNGLDWIVVTDNGLGDAQNIGMRTIASSPIGLFIGSATRSDAADPSGCSVWIGIAGVDPFAPVTMLDTPSPAEGSTVNSHSVSFAWTATDTPGVVSLPLVYASRLDVPVRLPPSRRTCRPAPRSSTMRSAQVRR